MRTDSGKAVGDPPYQLAFSRKPSGREGKKLQCYKAIKYTIPKTYPKLGGSAIFDPTNNVWFYQRPTKVIYMSHSGGKHTTMAIIPVQKHKSRCIKNPVVTTKLFAA